MRLTDKEQRHVRVAISFLRFRVGGWQPLADALGIKADSLGKVLRGARDVTARLLSPRTCPHCGRPPDDFADEETVVEDRPREAVLGVAK